VLAYNFRRKQYIPETFPKLLSWTHDSDDWVFGCPCDVLSLGLTLPKGVPIKITDFLF